MYISQLEKYMLILRRNVRINRIFIISTVLFSQAGGFEMYLLSSKAS